MNSFNLIRCVLPSGFHWPARVVWTCCVTLWLAIGDWGSSGSHGLNGALGQSLGEEPPATLGALLLKNDRVLLGKIERQGDGFLVRIADDSQVSIPRAQAQYLGGSVEDLYAYKRQTLTNPNTGDHFKLTRWCMANQLLDQAVAHYQLVAQEAGTHPKVQQLAVELRNQLLEDEEFRSYLGLPPVRSGTAAPHRIETASASVATGAHTGNRQVVLASHKLESPPHPLVVQRFSDRVQPLLISRCSQAACHGGQAANALKLINPNSKFFAHTSANNLESVLSFSRPDANQVVPLLAYATQAHGLQRLPGITITESALVAELQAWVELVSNPVVTAVAAAPQQGFGPIQGGLLPVGRDTEQLKQVPRGEALPDSRNPQALAHGVRSIEFPPGQSPPTLGELDALERQFNQLLPASPAPSNLPSAPSSRDPFDPAEFNRRMSQPAGDR